jgi:hypothetical protein
VLQLHHSKSLLHITGNLYIYFEFLSSLRAVKCFLVSLDHPSALPFVVPTKIVSASGLPNPTQTIAPGVITGIWNFNDNLKVSSRICVTWPIKKLITYELTPWNRVLLIIYYWVKEPNGLLSGYYWVKEPNGLLYSVIAQQWAPSLNNIRTITPPVTIYSSHPSLLPTTWASQKDHIWLPDDDVLGMPKHVEDYWIPIHWVVNAFLGFSITE